MRRTLAVLVTAASVLACASRGLAQQAPAATAIAPAPAAIDAQQVAVAGTPVRAGRVSTVIAAPFETVASVVLDFAHYRDFLPQVRQSRVVHRRRAQADVYLQVPLLANLGVLWALVRFDVIRTPGLLVINGVEQQGNVARLEFHFEVRATPGNARTQAVMQLLAVPALPLPTAMVSGQQARWAGRGLAAMRDRAEQTAASARATAAAVVPHPTGGGPGRFNARKICAIEGTTRDVVDGRGG